MTPIEKRVTSSPMSSALSLDNMPAVVTRFIELYRVLNKHNLYLLDEVYAKEVIFTDPMHSIHGVDALRAYFAKLYQNVESIHFDIHDVVASDSQAALYWVMEYRHPKLNRGHSIRVDGMSRLKFNDKIEFHRDYFDLGQMLYEQVPCLGKLIGLVKGKAAQ